jgi:hypothetical protein
MQPSCRRRETRIINEINRYQPVQKRQKKTGSKIIACLFLTNDIFKVSPLLKKKYFIHDLGFGVKIWQVISKSKLLARYFTSQKLSQYDGYKSY